MITVDDDVLYARAYLSRVAEPASLVLWDFVRVTGPVDAVRAIRSGRAPDAVTSLTSARRDSADPGADLDAAEHHGIRLICPESPDWPAYGLGSLERVACDWLATRRPITAFERYGGEPAPPLALWIKGVGPAAELGVRSAAIVGSRSASPYGEHVAALLAFGLAGHGVDIVSGGAFGIDAMAHRAAMNGEGATIIVSAGGLDRPYPAAHAELYAQAAASGLLISESPPGSAPQRHRFLSRNRLIAAFSTGTVVVEAAQRSGALNTAAHAVTLGRPLMVVPGPVTSAMSAGCHNLLRREDYGAMLIESVADVLGIVGRIGEGIGAESGQVAVPDLQAALDELDPLARRAFDGLAARGWRSENEVSARSGLTVIQVLRALPALQLAGLVDFSDRGYRIRSRPQPARPH